MSLFPRPLVERLTAAARAGHQRQQERIEQSLQLRAAVDRIRRRKLEAQLASDETGWTELSLGRRDDGDR